MLRKILMEPLVHFLTAGLTIFVLYSVFGESENLENRQATMQVPNNYKVVVSVEDAERIAAGFQRTWLRFPTSQELSGLIDDHVREEILVREAMEIGLEAGDAVIRQRLRQKMEYLLNATVEAKQVSDEALENHLTTFPNRFTKSGRAAFEQIFLGEAPSDEDIQDALKRLKLGENPDALSHSTALPAALASTGARRIDAEFGSGFWASLAAAPVGEWNGPHRSGYGVHLVLISELINARLPSLAEARELVEADWRKSMADELAERRYSDLKSRYDVQRMDQPK